MPVDEGLAERVREALGPARTTERKMFGGIAFHLEHPPAARTRRAENELILQRTLRDEAGEQ